MKLQTLRWPLLGGVLLLWIQSLPAEIVISDGEPILVPGHVTIRNVPPHTAVIRTTVPPPALVVRAEDLLYFLNGDKLHGRLVAVDATAGLLTWQHKAAPDPMRYQLAALDKLELLPRKVEGQPSQKNIVQLVNGDRLRGEVVTLDNAQLVFKTWYAGTLNIARARLAELTPVTAPADVFYEGPTSDLTGWITDGGGIRGSGLAYRSGGLMLPLGRPVGRKIPNLPEKVRFEFELSNHANLFFVFWFFSDSPHTIGSSDAYCMNFYGNRMEFQRMVRNEGNRNIGSISYDTERRMKSRLLVTILADRKERRFALLLDGKFMREFNDTQDFKGIGDSIMFQMHQASTMKISKIKIARWDGNLPSSENGSGNGTVDQDTLLFVNGDTMTGAVRSIMTNNIKFETSYAVLDVPLERVARMRLANKVMGAAPAATNAPAVALAQVPNGTTRCFFADQEAVTLKLDKIVDESVAGVAEGIGVLKIPLGALTHLEFNMAVKQSSGDTPDDEL